MVVVVVGSRRLRGDLWSLWSLWRGMGRSACRLRPRCGAVGSSLVAFRWAFGGSVVRRGGLGSTAFFSFLVFFFFCSGGGGLAARGGLGRL